ncbi:MAG TPA: putative lipid II flippase FtsW [Clostridiaceae bacterium]|nr:putative lipid II flippase FtsW [Clostridiaceae bacterium]
MQRRKPFDFWLFMTVLILLSIGIITVFSASAPFSHSTYQDIYYILKRQLAYAAIGIVAMLITMNIDYRIFSKFATLFLIVSICLLIAVFIPGIGINENGATRWIRYPIRFQPSEVAKIAIIIYFSHSLSKRKTPLNSFFKDLLPYLIIMGIFAALMLRQPHLSGTLILLSLATIILFCAGAKIKHFLAMFIPAGIAFAALITFVPYMRRRILSFRDPFSDMQGDGYQVVQSLYAIGSGGLFGRGLGKSMQKFLYLPYPHNDFIFSVLAEELGFLGVLTVMLLFVIFTWRGIKIAMCAPDTFGSLVAVGITSLITVQTLLNIAVVTAAMPPTGVSLPLFSYGGTSLILTMASIGILLNISRYANYSRI